MADIIKRISKLNKEKKPEDKSLLEELLPEALRNPPPEEEPSGIANLGSIGSPNLRMKRDGTLSGFQEISIESKLAQPPSPPMGLEEGVYAGMKEFRLEQLGPPPTDAAGGEAPTDELQAEGLREFTLEELGKPAPEVSFGALSPVGEDPKAEERQRYIQLVAAFLKEGHYEAAINMIREMRQQLGKPQ